MHTNITVLTRILITSQVQMLITFPYQIYKVKCEMLERSMSDKASLYVYKAKQITWCTLMESPFDISKDWNYIQKDWVAKNWRKKSIPSHYCNTVGYWMGCCIHTGQSALKRYYNFHRDVVSFTECFGILFLSEAAAS